MSKNKLRFKDNNGNVYPKWNSNKLLEEAKVYQPQTIQQKDFSADGYNVFGANGIIGKYKKYNHETSQIAISCRGNTCGTINYTTPFSWITGNAMVINVDDNKNINKEYLLHFMKTINFNEYISGSGQPQITRVALSKLELELPSLPEQEKIAALFSKREERIELRDQKIVNLKEYKKGLQQAVFGNNGERTLRFKDKNGNEYPEWVEYKFDDVFNSIPNKKYQIPSSKVLQEGQFEVVDQGQKNIAGYSNDKTKLYSEVPVIVYGDHTTTIKYRNTPFVVGADGTKMLKTKDSINILFALYSLDFNNVKPTGYNRHFSILREIALEIPCLEEQEKIANLFSKIDNQIELEEQLLQAAKDEKQGLMQRVF